MSFSTAHKNKANFDARTTNVSISVLTPNQVHFYPPNKTKFISTQNAEVKSIAIPTLKTSQFCMPPGPKTKIISIPTLNQGFFDPHTTPSQL